MRHADHSSDAPASMIGSSRDAAVFLQSPTLSTSVPSSSANEPVGPPGRVLVVDDDPKCLRLLRAYLAPEGYEVLEAGSGEEALETARSQSPDVVIVDALMPILSGYDVCRILKSDPVTRLLPIVLVSSLDERDDRVRGIDAGADDFLTRPLDRLEIVMRVRALVRQN